MNNYIVIARKWRPQTFDEIKGQDHVITTLKNSISAKRIAHAYLFTGIRGVGKTTAARVLAKALNCAQGTTINPCLSCASCCEIAEGKSIDVLEIDGASNRGIDRIRELREGIAYLPSRDRYKIYIIDEVHMLTTEAFNALLKTLEEPPSHVIFIFATTEPHKIPETITSRCQRFDFRRIPLRVIVEQIEKVAEKEDIKIAPDAIKIIARESEGSIRDSQSLLDQIISFAGNEIKKDDVQNILGLPDRQWFIDILKSLKDGNPAPAIEIVNQAAVSGVSIRQLMSNLANFLSESLRIKLGAVKVAELTFTDEEKVEVENIIKDMNLEFLSRMLGICLEGVKEVSISRLPKLSAELSVVRMAQSGTILPAQEILKKLEMISKKFETPSHPVFEAKKEKIISDEKERFIEKSLQIITEKDWAHFIDSISNTPHYELLNNAKFAGYKDNTIEIVFKNKEIYEKIVNDRYLLESLLEKRFNKKSSLLIKLVETEEKEKANNDRKMKINRLLNHPVTKKAQELFKMEIKNVKTY